MVASVRQFKANKQLNASGCSVTLDSAPLVGSLLVAGFAGPGTLSPTHTPPDGGWTQLATQLNAQARRASMFADVVDSGESSTVTFTSSVADATYHLSVWEIEGLNLSSYLDNVVLQEDTGLDVNLVFASTGAQAQADEIALLFAPLSAVSGGGHTITGSGTWTVRDGVLNNDLAVSGDRVLAATTALAPTAGWTTPRRSQGILLTLKASAGGSDPVANAGTDQTGKAAFSTVTLAGSATGGSPAYSYAWTQTGGTTVSLVGTGANRTFVAPATTATQTLTFQLQVTDSEGGVDTDTVTVQVIGHDRFRRTSSAWVGMNDKRRTGGAW